MDYIRSHSFGPTVGSGPESFEKMLESNGLLGVASYPAAPIMT